MPRFTIEQLLGRYISLRPRSEHEVLMYLQKKQAKFTLSKDQIDALVEKYKRIGFIDDEKFAESVRHSVIANKAKGSRFVAQKLQLAGVDKETIQSTIHQIDPEDLRQAMEKRLSKYETKILKLEPKLRKYKAYSILLSAGFSSSEVRKFLDELTYFG